MGKIGSQLVLKERPESKFVRVNFGQGIFQKMLRNFNPSDLTLRESNS